MQQSEKAVADDGGSLAKDGAVHVCPLSAVPDIVARSKASHLLTCLQDAVLVIHTKANGEISEAASSTNKQTLLLRMALKVWKPEKMSGWACRYSFFFKPAVSMKV